MATSLTPLTPNTENSTAKPLEDEAKPAMEFVRSNNKGRKPSGKGRSSYQKKQPQRGMGVEKLERLRIQERWKKMTETTATQFPTNPVVVHGVANNYGVPVMINGGREGLWGWGETAGLVMQRVVGNGGLGGFNGQGLVGPAHGNNVRVACGGGAAVVEASKELSSMPKLQYPMPDRCDVCFKKKRCNGENLRLNGGEFNQFGQVLPQKGACFHGWNLLENNQNINEKIHGFSDRASRTASAYAAGHMNSTNETADMVAIDSKGNSICTKNAVMEYEFFPRKNSRSTTSKEWKLPAEVLEGTAAEASSYANNASNCVDLSLKLSY